AAICAILRRCSSKAACSFLLDLTADWYFFLAILSFSRSWLYFSTLWSICSASLSSFFWTCALVGCGSACAAIGGDARETARVRLAAAAKRRETPLLAEPPRRSRCCAFAPMSSLATVGLASLVHDISRRHYRGTTTVTTESSLFDRLTRPTRTFRSCVVTECVASLMAGL